MKLSHTFRRSLINRMSTLKNTLKWSVTIEPIIVSEKNKNLDSRSIGNRLLYAIIDQQMDVENVVIPTWITMLIAGLDISTLNDIPSQTSEEILSAILLSHGAPRFYTSAELIRKGITKNKSLPFAITKAVDRINSRTKIKLKNGNVTEWTGLEDFAEFVISNLRSGNIRTLKKILAFSRDFDGEKLFSLAAEAVIDFFLRDIDILTEKYNVPIKIDVNNVKSGKLTGFLFEDEIIEKILTEQDIFRKKELYISYLCKLKKNTSLQYRQFQEIVRTATIDSVEAKDVNRFLFILGSDYCDKCITARGNKSCPLYKECLFTKILEQLPYNAKVSFVSSVRDAIRKGEKEK